MDSVRSRSHLDDVCKVVFGCFFHALMVSPTRARVNPFKNNGCVQRLGARGVAAWLPCGVGRSVKVVSLNFQKFSVVSRLNKNMVRWGDRSAATESYIHVCGRNQINTYTYVHSPH